MEDGTYNFKNKELNNLLLNRKGGKTTSKIIDLLFEQPYNLNQMSKILGLDYNTINHHICKLEKLEYVENDGEKYGALYYPSKKLLKQKEYYIKLNEKINLVI